jgi:hypothetical protein
LRCTIRALGSRSQSDFLRHKVRPCNVFYVSEEGPALWVERRDRLGMPNNVKVVCRPFIDKPSWPEWKSFLARVNKELKAGGFDLVVFDTISNLWPVDNENDASEVTKALMPLRGMIGADASLLLNHHLKKADGGELTGSRGSGGIIAFPDIVLELRSYDASDPRNTRRELGGKGRWPEATPAKLVIKLTRDDKGERYLAEGEKTEARAREVLKELKVLIPEGPPGKTTEYLLENLSDEVRPAKQTLIEVLQKGVEGGLWSKSGKGVRGDPYLYFQAPSAERDVIPLSASMNGRVL